MTFEDFLKIIFSKRLETDKSNFSFPKVNKVGSVGYQLMNLTLKLWEGSRSGTKGMNCEQ